MTVLITSGSAYSDIDAFACATALAEALQHKGQTAVAWLPGPPNLTIPAEFHHHPAFGLSCPAGKYDVILVDLSDPAHIPDELAVEQVVAVFDHHFGHEEFWASSDAKTFIEPVGAAATLIWEEILSLKIAQYLSAVVLKALCCAIVSNTACFRLPLTTQRDRDALETIEGMLAIETDWRERFLREMDDGIFKNLKRALTTDTKIIQLTATQSFCVGQIEVHDRARAIESLGSLVAAGEDLPDIVVVAARSVERTSLVSTRIKVAEKLADFYGVKVAKKDALFECRLPSFQLRKMMLQDFSRVMLD
ncbi:DHH family phosphoesterase [Sulfitobacter sp. S190]|uniref:DHH family phosphoesterase n=1 Tax=Sulfitobacter sp. S190 TaxID=2867022 RepID=UPI0021A69DB3|nr:DHH family phosphoesterase [Sulfitobacter sp. S190]UWR24629.1 DHH family phosphoesterase [Sulfitobacter sp. S190]